MIRDAFIRAQDASDFDVAVYLASFGDVRELLTNPELRALWPRLTRDRPLLFALLYLPHHLRSDETDGRITLSRFHVDLCVAAEEWARDDVGPAEVRDAWIAPRSAGKSTWVFLVLPLWALAHGHRRFVAAFADSGPQAQQHLTSFKQELDKNEALRADFPDLCAAAVRPTGVSVADTQALYIARSGAAFMARGIDSSTLGAKVGNQRPDVLLFDDVEPDASNYSEYQKDKRLATIVNAVFPMNTSAVVCIAGTTTMAGSIVHDLVRQHTEPRADDLPTWPAEEHIRVRYYPALEEDQDGVRRSLWPARWPLAYLESVEHTTSFALNMQNQPAHREGDYWGPQDLRYDTLGPEATRWILEVDPAVTTKGTSDWTGLAVIGYAPPRKIDPGALEIASRMEPGSPEQVALVGHAIASTRDANGARHGRCEVAYAAQVKLSGERLRAEVLRVLGRFPRIRRVRVEVNQGGELWATILHHLPDGVRLVTHTVSASKEVRFAEALEHYQLGRVVHRERFPTLEAQLTGFPRMAHDDVADAVVGGVLYFLSARRRVIASERTESYV